MPVGPSSNPSDATDQPRLPEDGREAAAARPGWAYGLVGFAVVASGIAAIVGGSAPQVAAACVLGLAVVATAISLVRNRPAPGAAWWCIAVGMTTWGAGAVVWAGLDSSAAQAGGIDALSLLAFVPLIVGQMLLGRARGQEHTRDGVIDGSILALVAVLLAWVAVVSPEVSGTDTVDRVVIALYPLLDVLLLMGVVWIALLPGRRSASLFLLGAGYAVALLADIWWYVGLRFDTAWHDRLDGLYPIALALIAAAVIHPASRYVSERPKEVDHDRVHSGRLFMLAAAMFAGPVAAMAADGEFGARDVVVTLCCLVVVGLVIARFVELVRENERTRRRFRLLAENVPVGIYEVTESLEISFANNAADRLFGRSIEREQAPALLAFIDPADHPEMIQAADAVLAGTPAEAAFRLVDPNGPVRWVQWRGTPVADQRRGLPTALASTLDITALKEAQAALERLATHDALTQLPNRRLLSSLLITALARRGRHPGTIALMFCDLDGFKTVNDVYGHDAGDAILVEIGRRLCTTVRATDSVARIGGDEFVVLCEEAGTHDDLAHLAGKLVGAVNQPWEFDDNLLSVGVSIGIAIAGTDDDVSSLLRRADDAMYQAKAGGRNQYRFAIDEDPINRDEIANSALSEVARLHRVGEVDR